MTDVQKETRLLYIFRVMMTATILLFYCSWARDLRDRID